MTSPTLDISYHILHILFSSQKLLCDIFFFLFLFVPYEIVNSVRAVTLFNTIHLCAKGAAWHIADSR